MVTAVPMAEMWRGGLMESRHLGHAVICDAQGAVVESWGDPAAVIFPRSACKMVQALPLIESGAAAAAGLTDRQLALSCASHEGAALHVGAVRDWLAGIGAGEAALRCGSHEPFDRAERNRLIKTDDSPCQYHNNCSGKHAGFVTLNRHVEIAHPVQRAIRKGFEEVTDETVAGWGLDGCSAPNFATSVHGLARALARFAAAGDGTARGRAMRRLSQAMATYPEMVAGEGRACTELMRAMGGRVAIKTGAEGVFVAIIPEKRMGLALKIADGASRASEAAVAALLVRLGVLDPAHPAAVKRLNPVQKNWRGFETGEIRTAAGFPQ